MLPAANRLNKEKDIKRVLRLGRSLFSPYFRLKYLQNNLKKTRVTVVVSTKFSKKAVERNRVKRQIREIFRLNLAKISLGCDFVLSVAPAALGTEYQKLEKEILFLLNKAKLLL
ncbi:MAG: ribonuclease P protein component [Candidatus Buchananbacteria bacterium]